MSTAQIDEEYMRQAAVDARGLADELAADANKLMGAVEPMVTGLQGAAGLSFQSIKETIETNMKIIDQALESIADGIESTGRDMSASDDDSSSSMTSSFESAGGDDAVSALTSGR